jgi:hypothetical protein
MNNRWTKWNWWNWQSRFLSHLECSRQYGSSPSWCHRKTFMTRRTKLRARARGARRDKAKREVTSSQPRGHRVALFITVFQQLTRTAIRARTRVRSRPHSSRHSPPRSLNFTPAPMLYFHTTWGRLSCRLSLSLTRVTNKQFIRYRDRQIPHDFPRLLPFLSLSAIFACYLTRYSLFSAYPGCSGL